MAAATIGYAWKECRHSDGSVEYRLQCPLKRGQHRPAILVHEGSIYATSITGYTHMFYHLDDAKHFAEKGWL